MNQLQPDLFSVDQDETILILWNTGANLEQIAVARGTTQVRAAHDVNRVLNKQTIGMDFARFREMSPL
jgi:hypothetical protein